MNSINNCPVLGLNWHRNGKEFPAKPG